MPWWGRLEQVYSSGEEAMVDDATMAGAPMPPGGSVGPEGSILALFLLMAMSVAAVLLLRKQPGHPALVITPASGISGK